MEFSIPVPGQNEILGQFANRWYEFVNHFQCHQDQSGQLKTPFLLHYGAQTMKEFRLSNKISAEEFPRFSACLEMLEAHCLFQIVLCFVRHLFFTHCRRTGSTIEEFHIELRLLSEWCSFDNSVCDNIIKNQLIGNIQDKSARDVLVSVNNLTAENVTDVCSIAEKQGSVVNAEILNMYILDQQQKSCHNLGNKGKKEFGWSSFQETQAEISQGLNLSTLFRSDNHCLNETRKSSLPDFSGKHNSFPNFNYSIVDQVSDPSFFPPNKVTTVGVTYPQTNEALTNFAPQFHPSTNFTLPFPESQPPQPSTTVQRKESENLCLKKCLPKTVAKQTVEDNKNSSNANNNNNNNDNLTGDASNEGNGDDILMCILDPNDDSNRDEGEQKPSVSYVATKDDVNEIPAVFVSQQKAILKTSQIIEATGQTVDVYSCNFCVFSCAGKSGIEEHAMQVHKSLKCFVCTACNFKFPCKELIDSHIRIKHLNVEEHKCQICDMVFASQSKLFLHLQGHAETRTVSCRVCSAMFTTEKLLSEHMSNVHPSADRWICRVCGDTFSVRKALSDHVSDAHKEKDNDKISRRFICKLCDITFTDKKSSEMHKKKYHRKSHVKRFPCDQCDHICSSNANLISHRRIHTGEKPYMCEICGKEFSQSSSLDKHTRIHTGEKPYKCQYCNLSFNTSSNRLVHERNHRKERPYVCEQCGKTFRNSYELKVHIDTHNEFRTKRFICHCGAAFDTKRKLKRHEVCHTGQKPYKCEICGAGFTRSENVKGHQKSQACRNRVLKLQS